MTSQNNYSLQEILYFVRINLLKDGYDKMRILGKNFREMPSYDGYNKINKDEFLVVMRDIGILLPKHAAEKVVQHYDLDLDGCVNFEDFLIGIRNKPNELRQEIIDRAFAKFDKGGNGLIDVRDLRGTFDASKHTKVLSGEITQEQAFENFFKNFNDKGGGLIDKLEWDDFYSVVSFDVENDEHFVILLQTEWRMD